MKTLLTILLSILTQVVIAENHLPDQRSPIMGPSGNPKFIDKKGVWIPNRFGLVTRVMLDLDQIGSDNLLKARSSTSEKFEPALGKHYKKHSDITAENELGRMQRTVILISDKRNLKRFGYKDIICYTASYQPKKVSKKGDLLQAEETYYRLTISRIKNDFEVLFHIPFGAAKAANKPQ